MVYVNQTVQLCSRRHPDASRGYGVGPIAASKSPLIPKPTPAKAELVAMTVAAMRRLPTSHSPLESSSSAFRASQHQHALPTSRSQEQTSLPPIREALAFYYAGPPSSTGASSRAASVPSVPPLSTSPNTASESLVDAPESTYMLSNENERHQRISFGDGEREREERLNQIPRGYSMPYNLDHHGESSSLTEGACTGSVGSSPPSSCAFSSMADGDAWPAHHHRRSGPHQMPPSSGWDMGAGRAPEGRRYTDSAGGSVHYSGSNRPPLPGLPHMVDDHPHQQPHHLGQAELPPASYSGPGPYQQHPSRAQSLSAGSIRSFDRVTFPPSASSSSAGPQYDHCHSSRSSSSYHRHPQEYYGSNEFRSRGPTIGHGDHGGHGNIIGSLNNGRLNDSKQRKRRGNLPKETTDKLRAWFSDHLHHPYPSEDEKQELMQQTGLQMNQISNWFINARRRHLPALINNARAVSGAMSTSRGGSNSVSTGVPGVAGSMDGIRSSSTVGIGPGSVRHKGLLTPTDRMYTSPDRMYGSFERPLEPRPSSIYNSSDRVDQRHISPPSDDDYDSMLPPH